MALTTHDFEALQNIINDAIARAQNGAIKLAAQEAVKTYVKEVHVPSCPYGQALNVFKAKVAGVLFGVAAASGAVGGALARFLL